jgi:PAS domain S-box-containing protein
VSGFAHGSAPVGRIRPDALLDAVIEMSDDAIFTCDAKGAIATWCATAQRLFGRGADDTLGRPFDEIFPEHLRHEVRDVLTAVLAGDRVRHFETEVQRRDGMPMPVSLSLSPLLDTGQAGRSLDDPSADAIVITVRDVTEQRLDQATLAEFEARLEEGEALAHVGSWLWDLRTGVVQWSAEFHRIHGVRPVDFDGTFESYLELVLAEDRAQLRTAMERSASSGRSFECEYRVSGSGAPNRFVRVIGQATSGSSGEVVGVRGVGREVEKQGSVSVTPGRQDA